MGWGKARALLKDGISVTSESGEEVLPSQARRLPSRTPATIQQVFCLHLLTLLSQMLVPLQKNATAHNHICSSRHAAGPPMDSRRSSARFPFTPSCHVLSQMLVLHAKQFSSGRWWAPTALGDGWR